MKKFLLNPWTIGIGTSLIATTITALVKDINILQAGGWLIDKIFAFFVFLLTYKIPVYALLLLLLVIAAIVKFKRNEKPQPEWLKYKNMRYKNWFFTWEYYLGYNNKYSIKDLRPICICGCELTHKTHIDGKYYSNGGVLYCPKCHKTYPLFEQEVLQEVESIIDHDIKTNQFPKE